MNGQSVKVRQVQNPYIAYDLLILTAAISPGPAFVLTARTALRTGKAAGLLVALGVVLAASTWLNLAFFGLAAIFQRFPLAETLLAVLGAIYFLYLALHLWRDAKVPLEMNIEPAKQSFFAQGYLINIANPKAPIYVLTIVATTVHARNSLEWLPYLAHHFVIEFGWLAFCVFVLSSRSARGTYLNYKHFFDRACAIALVIIAFRLIFTHIF